MSVLQRLILLLMLLACPNFIQSASSPESPVTLTNQSDRPSLSQHLSILEDPQRMLSIQQITTPEYAEQFYPNTQDIPNFGRTRSAYWIKFTLNNQSSLKWYIRINALLGYDVTLYVLNDEGQIVTERVARYQQNYGPHTWSLTLPQQENLQFYLRATNGDSIFSLPIELFASDAFVEQTRLDHNFYGGIIAALLVMGIYNLLSFFVLRESSYLALSIHIFSVAAAIHFTWPVYTYMGFLNDTAAHFFTAPIYTASISLLAFCRALLETKTTVPWLDKRLYGLIFIASGLIFITGWIPQGTLLPLLIISLSFLLIMLAGIIRYRQGSRIAGYFLLIFVLVGFITMQSVLVNLFDSTQWQSAKLYLTGIATLAFPLLLSLLQSEQVRRWREREQRVNANKKATENFLMTISHELRTPMQALISIGELLSSTPLNSAQKKYLHQQDKASQHMLGLVNDLLDLGAMSRGNPINAQESEAFELQTMLDDLHQLFSAGAEQKGLSLTIDTAPAACPSLLGDARHLKQVLVNLLDNAIKYTDRGGIELNVNLENKHNQPVMAVTFEVCDTGSGIPAEQHPYIFEPFFQVKHSNQQHSGSGLGLAISHQWVKQMGGDLQLRNPPNGGSCFFFTLNLAIHAENEYKEIANSHKETNLMSLQGIRILLVDDDSINQLVGQKLLTSQGADVLVAASGQEAIRQLREQPCDLVLMDLGLPDIDGYETTRLIRADKDITDCPIIALTAHATGTERENCLNAGMNDYLAKPYNTGELIKMLLKHR